MSAAPHADADEASRWLELLWPAYPEGEWLSIFSANSSTRQTTWADTPEAAARAIASLPRDQNVWIGCATRAERLSGNARGGAAACRHIPGLWLDVDIAGPAHAADNLPPDRETALEVLEGFPLPPSAIVESGNGLQVWWLFDEPVALADAAHVLDDWAYTWSELFADAEFGLDNVFDSARILRVPGTLNHKTDPPKPVTIIQADGPRYGLDDLDQYLTAAPQPAPATLRPKVPYIGPERPGDAFNAQVKGGEVLANAGWTFVRRDRSTGDEHWKHPTSTNDTSATVYADDGHITLWTDSFPGVPPRRPFDPFGLYAHLRHGGDFRSATRAVSAAGFGAKAMSREEIVTVLEEPPERQASETPPEEPPKPLLTFETLGETLARVDEMGDPGYLLEPIWPADAYGILGAESKAGKTWLACDLTLSVAAGTSWMGIYPARQGPVVYFIGEGGPRNTARRMRGVAKFHGIDIADVIDDIHLCYRAPQLTKADHLTEVTSKIQEVQPALVIIDPLYLAAGGADSSSLFAMGEVFANIQTVCEDAGAALIIIHHWNQTGSGKGKGRLSGAGGEEWGRVVASAAVVERKTEEVIGGKRTIVDLEIEFVGGEIPDTKIMIRRTIEAANGLMTPMTYNVERVSVDPQRARLDILVGMVAKVLDGVLDGVSGRQLETLKPSVLAGQKVTRNEWREAIDAAIDRGVVETFSGPQRSVLHRLAPVDNPALPNVVSAPKSAPNAPFEGGASAHSPADQCAEVSAHSAPHLTRENGVSAPVRQTDGALKSPQCASAPGPTGPAHSEERRTETHSEPRRHTPSPPSADAPPGPFDWPSES